MDLNLLKNCKLKKRGFKIFSVVRKSRVLSVFCHSKVSGFQDSGEIKKSEKFHFNLSKFA